MRKPEKKLGILDNPDDNEWQYGWNSCCDAYEAWLKDELLCQHCEHEIKGKAEKGLCKICAADHNE